MKTRKQRGANIPMKNVPMNPSYDMTHKLINHETSIHHLEMRIQTLESVIRQMLYPDLTNSKRVNLINKINVFSKIKPIYGGTRKRSSHVNNGVYNILILTKEIHAPFQRLIGLA